MRFWKDFKKNRYRHLIEQINIQQKEFVEEQAAEIARSRVANEVTEVAKRVAHDIRSPLTALLTLSQTMNDLKSVEKEILNDSIARISGISEDILSRSRNLSSQSHKKFDLGSLVASLVSQKRMEFHQMKNLEIFFDGGEHIVAWGNPVSLGRVISNLINNSVEASASQIWVRIEMTDKGFVTVRVEDNGQGIQGSLISQLGREQVTTKPNGNGIGLLSAQEYLQSVGGTLSFSSGRGQTRAEITIPRMSA